jgi:hypothetical protein
MRAASVSSLEGRLYRAALSLCPGGFRREHGHEMVLDFDEAHREAAADGEGALWVFRLAMAIDLVRAFGTQWFRTGVPAIGLVSILITLALAEGIATVARRATIFIPADAAEDEILGVLFLFLAVISVMLIAMTIVLTQWVNRPRRRGRR